ncbi:hypothetical protein R1flu_009999 [Riccia fluitans]|uniref:Dienelactone hydrolase domain-containing protein n=1 Tax=Riccia fluitans TaxID=41844 RepID=A0ABD1Z6R8_9MARC
MVLSLQGRFARDKDATTTRKVKSFFFQAEEYHTDLKGDKGNGKRLRGRVSLDILAFELSKLVFGTKRMAPGDCCRPPPPSKYEGQGVEEKWHGVDVYTTGSPSSSSAVVFICDIYGWEVPQTRYLADRLAASGHYVVVADFLDKDYFCSPNPDDEYEGLPEWLDKHSKPQAIDRASRIIETLRGKGVKKIGVMGNCWGAKITISLLFGDKGVDAAVMNHPSFLTIDEVKAVKVPLAIHAARIDFVTTPEMAKEYEDILASSLQPETRTNSYVKIFEGADHGWTTRYDDNDETACQRAEEAHADTIAFFHKHLHPPAADTVTEI